MIYFMQLQKVDGGDRKFAQRAVADDAGYK